VPGEHTNVSKPSGSVPTSPQLHPHADGDRVLSACFFSIVTPFPDLILPHQFVSFALSLPFCGKVSASQNVCTVTVKPAQAGPLRPTPHCSLFPPPWAR